MPVTVKIIAENHSEDWSTREEPEHHCDNYVSSGKYFCTVAHSVLDESLNKSDSEATNTCKNVVSNALKRKKKSEIAEGEEECVKVPVVADKRELTKLVVEKESENRKKNRHPGRGCRRMGLTGHLRKRSALFISAIAVSPFTHRS